MNYRLTLISNKDPVRKRILPAFMFSILGESVDLLSGTKFAELLIKGFNQHAHFPHLRIS